MILACDEARAEVKMDEDAPSTFGASLNPARARIEIAIDREHRLSTDDRPDVSPEQLAGRAQAGCRDSFEQLVLRHEQQIFNFILQFTRQRQDAEDLTQETFLKAYRSLPRYRPSLAFTPWLFTIARRTAASHFRSAKRFEELPDDGGQIQETPANLLESLDEQNSIWRLARTLKPKQFEVLWLRYHEGFSCAETAAVMRTNQVHVKVLLHRARANLSGMLAARGRRPVELKK
jgi:RNA polymerase sigma-70 factor (ECF subfamily)